MIWIIAVGCFAAGGALGYTLSRWQSRRHIADVVEHYERVVSPPTHKPHDPVSTNPGVSRVNSARIRTRGISHAEKES